MNNSKSPFDTFIKPIFENLFAPIFAYIAAFAIGSVVSIIFTEQSTVFAINDSVSFFSMLAALLTLAATAIITVGRFLSDDVGIIMGKAMQEPRIQKLKAENTRLKLRIETLLHDAPQFSLADKEDGFANEQLEIPTHQITNVELEPKSQHIFDNAIWLWNRIAEGKKITKAVMTDKDGEGMAQPAWTKASNALIATQVLDSNKELLIKDKELVVQLLYEYLGDV